MYTLTVLDVDSTLLRGNRAGDPHQRRLLVLSPEGHDARQPLPAVWMLPGHGGSQGGFLADDPWREGLSRRVSRLTETGAMPPALFVLPDLFTRYGGSQGVDSAATGPYASHLVDELFPLLESRFAVRAHGLAGHSSGGYAALVNAMRRPDRVRAAACHAGDLMFEFSYQPDFPKAAARLRAEGGPEKLLAAFEKAAKKQDGKWLSAMNVIAMAACYSPDDAEPLGIALPFDPQTCELREDVWRRWLACDPLRMVDLAAHREALKSLRLLFVDAGSRDEWNLQWGARALRRKLDAYGIAHVYEEFDDGHMGTAYRFDRSLPLMVRALAG